MKRIGIMTLATLTLVMFSLCIMPHRAEAALSMHLTPGSPTISVGETVVFNVNLENPTPAQSFDGFDIWLKFDPTKLKVRNTSEGNWTYQVSTETQIYDSSHFFGFNTFSQRLNNEVDNSEGWIFYSVGGAMPALNSNGTFAQITFEGLSVVENTGIYFDFDEPIPPYKSTQALLGGIDYLEGAVGASVTVVPEPASILLFGTGLFGLFGFVRRRSI